MTDATLAALATITASTAAGEDRQPGKVARQLGGEPGSVRVSYRANRGNCD